MHQKLLRIAKTLAGKLRSGIQSAWLSYPKKIQCNICAWEGRYFLSDSWHEHINCPKCRSGIRQRLFIAALQNIPEFSKGNLFGNKRVLHFAPEQMISKHIKEKAVKYVTADFLRQDCDIKLDMSNMPEIKDESFDVVIAFDVLEHVPDYQLALAEVNRVLSENGRAIFTVPQKDNLENTVEDHSIVTPEDRIKHYGQWDHLRLFGNDFSSLVAKHGFSIRVIDETDFSELLIKKHVLFPPKLSSQPLATNYRKVFLCQKSV